MFQLANPWILVLIAVPLLVWLLLPAASLFLPAALRVPFYQALQPFVDRETHKPHSLKNIALPALAWILVLLAAAGPQWVGQPVPLAREGRNIMLVLDLSGSMGIDDMALNGRQVSRLTVVKKAAEDFVKKRTGDHLGLILFGSQAYLQTPLTYDHQNVLLRIRDATVGLAGKTTSLGDALGLAVKRLLEVPAKSRVVILLTDGASNSGVLVPRKAAEFARADGIKVYTIGLGSEAAFQGDIFDIQGAADLDEETLQEIAKMTGGAYFRATDASSLQKVYDTINRLETVSQSQATVQPRWEYYPWPLALGLLLLLYWFGRKSVTTRSLLPLVGEGLGMRASYREKTPSPPTPLPHAGEGSKQWWGD